MPHPTACLAFDGNCREAMRWFVNGEPLPF
jgi:hypothetical protein